MLIDLKNCQLANILSHLSLRKLTTCGALVAIVLLLEGFVEASYPDEGYRSNRYGQYLRIPRYLIIKDTLLPLTDWRDGVA